MDELNTSADSDFDISDEELNFSGDESDFDIDNEPESDGYDSESSEASFVGQETREEAAKNDSISLLSKDKTIQYSLEPLATARPPPSHGQCRHYGATAYASARIVDPLSAFLLIIEPIEKIIVDNTNLYGARRYKNKWKPVDIHTMRAYYGVLLLAGVYRSKDENITELWDDQNGRPIFRATMSISRFRAINRCIRFDGIDERARAGGERDKLAPIRNIFDKWVHRMKSLYVPGKNVTVDKQLMPFHGRCPFTQYFPSKPAKYGIKIWILGDSESYYAWNLEVYFGRNRNAAPEVNQGEQVVLRLAHGLKGRNVTCDNFFTSHSLATKLKSQQMTLVGAIRKNRMEIPPILVDMKTKPAHFSQFVFDHRLRATMVSYVPKYRKFVTLLSTYHSDKEKDTQNAEKPSIFQYYNATKGAVDKLDEMVGTYRCKTKVLRWPLALFENMLDISACNALALFLHLQPDWKFNEKNYRRRLFLIEVGKGLTHAYIDRREHIPRGERARDVICDIRDIPRDISPSVTSSSSIASPIPWLSNLRHAQLTKKRARCSLCPKKSNANVHSARCDKCNNAICPGHRFILCEKCCGTTHETNQN